MTTQDDPISEREVDEMIDWLCDALARNLRSFIVALLFILSAMIFGVTFWKAFTFGAALLLVMMIPIGRRRLEQVAGIWFFVALVYWLDIPAVNKLVDLFFAKIS
jgi:hypothetical protein